MEDEKLGYQANGRLKRTDQVEKANLTIKKFICPNCRKEVEGHKLEFGEQQKCPDCGTAMLQHY